MMRPLTRFLPLSRSGDNHSSEETKLCAAFSRVQAHVDEVRRYFELPADELFLDEFYCALRKRILLQGRMYIFERHLCFYSNVFGLVKRKVIPLHQIKDITKRRNYGFPNSIEVAWRKAEFFTSFLNRSDAYQLLCTAVKHAQDIHSAAEEVEGDVLTSEHRAASTASSSSTLASRPSGGRSPKRRSKGSSDAGDDDSDLDQIDEDMDVWKVIPGAAPGIPEDMEMLCVDRYDVSVQDFFARILSMDSMFLDDYHKRRGDMRYRVSAWEEVPEISGAVRQAAFVSPVKGVGRIGFISPKTTECNQDHRLRIYHGDHLVFEISQVMKDIPYGDNFSVEIRWDVKPLEDGSGCQISIHVAVPFIRSVLAPFRSMIESNVMKEMQESVKVMTEMLGDMIHAPTAPEEQNPGVDPIEDDESMTVGPTRSGPLPTKLQTLLNNEDNVHRLEQLIGSMDLANGVPSMELPANVVPKPSPTPQMVASSFSTASTANWILFFGCLFTLVCHVFLILLWTPPKSNLTHQGSPFVERLEGSLHHPAKQLHELEETLGSVIHTLNLTLAAVKQMH